MSNKKRVAKFLRIEAAKLPPEEYTAYHKYFKMEYHMDGEQAIPVWGEMQKHKVNHARRLKRLYIKYGKEAVSKYFNDRGFKLIPKDESNNQVTEK